MFEALEQRQLMSAGIGQNGGGPILIVQGTAGSDEIIVSVQSNGRIRVSDNGVVTSFPRAQVTKIYVLAGAGNDRVTVGTSVDIGTRLLGEAGNDTIRGGSGRDGIDGGTGHDVLFGRGGNDVLEGKSGRDTLYGGGGRDALYGNANNDVLVSVGGGQHDTLRGGDGTDTFWADRESTEELTSGSAETVHRIDRFRDLRVQHPSGSATVQSVDRALDGPSLIDPRTSGTYADFADRPLFADAGPRMGDASQEGSDAHDCYFIATLMAVARQNPNFVARNAVDLGDGTYAVRFQTLFGAEYVRVDGDLPTASGGALKYARLGADGSTWAPILEKAWAFFRRNEGTYASIDWGSAGEVLDALGLGGLRETIHGWGYGTASALFNRLASELSNGHAIIVSSKGDARDHVEGMRNNHMFVMDRVEQDSAGVRRIVLLDPRNRVLKLTAQQIRDTCDGFTVLKLT
jgi:hypothetical protein